MMALPSMTKRMRRFERHRRALEAAGDDEELDEDAPDADADAADAPLAQPPPDAARRAADRDATAPHLRRMIARCAVRRASFGDADADATRSMLASFPSETVSVYVLL